MMANIVCVICIFAIPVVVLILADISGDLAGIRTELQKIREEKETENERFWRLKYERGEE